MTESLYDRLGGRQSLHTLIDLFYYKVLLDPALKRKFIGADMMSLKEHQLEFMTFVFGGGGKHYPLDRLHDAHQNLNISEAEFQSICSHLRESMEELHVQRALVAEVMALVNDTHDLIVKH